MHAGSLESTEAIVALGYLLVRLLTLMLQSDCSAITKVHNFSLFRFNAL